jgi:lysophospholipase L1-like esterase
MISRNPIQSTDIVFLGDSITEGFDLEYYFKRPDIKNRGTSGDTTHQVLYRLIEITNAKPAKVFLMIGINDLFNDDSEDEVFNNIKQIIERIQRDSPETKLYIQSILPVNETLLLVEGLLNVMIYKVNDELKKLCKEKSMIYIDLHSDFLNNTGQLDLKYTFDGGHLTSNGYDLWAKSVLNYL